MRELFSGSTEVLWAAVDAIENQYTGLIYGSSDVMNYLDFSNVYTSDTLWTSAVNNTHTYKTLLNNKLKLFLNILRMINNVFSDRAECPVCGRPDSVV